MGVKLSTRSGSDSVLVNVKGEKGQYFVGTLLAHKQAKSIYKNEDGSERSFNIYEFKLEDSDMSFVKKDNGSKEYKEVTPAAGDQVSVFAPTRLNNALCQAEVGQKIKFEYLGLVKAGKKGGKANEYDVEIL